MSESLLALASGADDLLVDLIADIALAFQRDHVIEAGPVWDRDRSERDARVFIAYVFHEQQHQDIILVLAGIHAAAQLVATRPEGGVEFRFL